MRARIEKAKHKWIRKVRLKMPVIIGDSINEMLSIEDKPKSTAKGSSIKSLSGEIENRANERIIHDVFANDILEGE